MAFRYTHDSEHIIIANCINPKIIEKKLKLPKGTWHKKLDKVNKKIKKFKIDKDIKWVMSVNNQTIDPSNVTQFEQILSITPPPITIKIIQVHTLHITCYIHGIHI